MGAREEEKCVREEDRSEEDAEKRVRKVEKRGSFASYINSNILFIASTPHRIYLQTSG